MNFIKIWILRLSQRCPTEFLCSPQLWWINKAIHNILNDIAKEHLLWPILQILHPRPSLFTLFWYFQVWIKFKKAWLFLLFGPKPQKAYFWGLWKQSHSPHSNGHSPHVASGEWVGQRWTKSTIDTLRKIYLLF